MPPYRAKETVEFFKYKNVQTSADGVTPVTYQYLKIGKKEVPVFSHGSPTDFLYFIRVLQNVETVLAWKADDTKENIPMCLEGPAYRVFEGMTSPSKAKILLELANEFLPPEPFPWGLERFRNFTMKESETVEQFRLRFHVVWEDLATMKTILVDPANHTTQLYKDDMPSEKEKLRVMVHGVKRSWFKDALQETFDDEKSFLSWCRRRELAETLDKKRHGGPEQKAKHSGKKNSESGKDYKRSSEEFFCEKHGSNKSHATQDCKVLKAEREKAKDNQPGRGGQNFNTNAPR
jgi:uncharacterized protein YifE (UPF0438 family)